MYGSLLNAAAGLASTGAHREALQLLDEIGTMPGGGALPLAIEADVQLSPRLADVAPRPTRGGDSRRHINAATGATDPAVPNLPRRPPRKRAGSATTPDTTRKPRSSSREP